MRTVNSLAPWNPWKFLLARVKKKHGVRTYLVTSRKSNNCENRDLVCANGPDEAIPYRSAHLWKEAVSHYKESRDYSDLKRLQSLLNVQSRNQEEMLHSLGGIENLGQYMETVANRYLNYREEQHNVDKLVNRTYSYVFFGALLALTSLVECPECREEISEVVENLRVILLEYDFLSNRFTTELLLLCAESVKEQIKMYEEVPVLLSLLHSDHIKLLWSIAWILVQVCEDPETSVEIIWGRIKQLLHMLQEERSLVSDSCIKSSVGSLSSANAAGKIQYLHLSDGLSPDEIQENTFSLQAANCAAITELVLNETNAYQVVQANTIYTIAKLILSNKERNAEKTRDKDELHQSIHISHLSVAVLKEDVLKQIAERAENMNQNKGPTNHVGNDAILEHLGSGAFGSIYKAKKHSGQHLLAMKEVNLHNPAFGKNKNDRDSSAKKVSELTIIKGQLYHLNFVWYYRTFLENDRLYIVMDIMDRVPLGDQFHYFKEKQKQFTEDRIRHLFILCLALCYLHKEKRIVHDLTVNNIMLEDKDKATITDFGLAKQREENCRLASVVKSLNPKMVSRERPWNMLNIQVTYLGRLMLIALGEQSPEVVKGELYGEKTDVWAAGCILEQMPPVYSINMPSLATEIVGAMYEPVPEGLHSENVSFTIKSLTPDAEAGPDMVEVRSLLPHVMMKYLEFLSTYHLMLEKKLDWERRQTQWYLMEANNEVTYHHQLHLSQVFSLNDNEIDIVDNSSSSSSSNLEESAVGKEETNNTEEGAVKKGTCKRALAGIAVSQGKVHQISDPVQQILVQLHKIIFSTKLPPALQCSLERRIVERFKKSLFCQKSNPCKLESEIKKNLLRGLQSAKDLNFTSLASVYSIILNLRNTCSLCIGLIFSETNAQKYDAAELIELNIFTAD
ncbi:LOW QUALITY PROTEIN: serine/threonine-protein kinase Nek10 [Geothlypis trichas]